MLDFGPNTTQFDGLGVLSTIMFLLNIVLFITLCTVLLLRIIWFPRAIIESCKSNISELSMVGGVPIALFTIVAQVSSTCTSTLIRLTIETDWAHSQYCKLGRLFFLSIRICTQCLVKRPDRC